MYKRKNLGTKPQELSNIMFLGRLFVSESMPYKNQELVYKCQQRKSVRNIHSTWFFKNAVNVKLTERGKIQKIFYVTDIKDLLEKEKWEEYINNASF